MTVLSPLYFAYGSNLSTARLRSRVADARPMTVASVDGFRFCFDKPARDGSGRATLREGDADEKVWGVLYELSAPGKTELDRHEGLGKAYRQERVTVITPAGVPMRAWTYLAIDMIPGLRPRDWYLTHVLNGASEHALPGEYVEMLASFPFSPDPDRIRYDRELSIYPAP